MSVFPMKFVALVALVALATLATLVSVVSFVSFVSLVSLVSLVSVVSLCYLVHQNGRCSRGAALEPHPLSKIAGRKQAMGNVIGNILPSAIGVAISPVPIIAVILMLFSQRARSNSSARASLRALGAIEDAP